MTPDDLLAGYLETGAFDATELGQLSPDEQAFVRAEQPALDRLRGALTDDAFWAEPDPDLEDRVLDHIMAMTGQPADLDLTDGAVGIPSLIPAGISRTGGADPSAGLFDEAELPSGDQDLRSGDRRSREPATETTGNVVSLAEARARRSRAVSIGASIVAAAAVVVAIIGFGRSPSPSGDIAAPITTTTTAVGLDLDVTGTDLAPGTSGKLRLEETDSGVRIHLEMPGLPRRDNGQFYEAWVRTDKGLVPIGTFHTGDDVTLWSGIEMNNASAITVTLEDNDGNQESSGRRVILAPLKPAPPGSAPTTSPTTAASTTPP